MFKKVKNFKLFDKFHSKCLFTEKFLLILKINKAAYQMDQIIINY